MKRPKRFSLLNFSRDDIANSARAERRIERKFRRLEWRLGLQKDRLLFELHNLGPSEPLARMADISIHECDEFNIGPGITGALSDAGYTTARHLWEENEPLVPYLPGIGPARQAMLSRWVQACWERCVEEALDATWRSAELRSRVETIESTLASKRAELDDRKAACQERRPRKFRPFPL